MSFNAAVQPAPLPEGSSLTARYICDIFRSQDNTFCVCQYQVEDSHEYATVVGPELPKVKYPVTFSGTWKDDSKYGRQFRADAVVSALPEGNENIIEFISSLRVGIGKSKAKKMVELTGPQRFWDVLENSPEQFLAVRGITNVALNKLLGKTAELNLHKRLLALVGNDLPLRASNYRAISKLFPGRLASVVEEFQSNPYLFCQAGFTFLDVDIMAQKRFQVDLQGSQRLEAAASQALMTARQSSHVGLPVEEAISAMVKLLGASCPKARISEFLSGIPGDTNSPFCLEGDFLYTANSRKQEAYIADRLRTLVTRPMYQDDIPTVAQFLAILREYESKEGITLEMNQSRAVSQCLSNRVSIITGGPGTGKSTILKAILYAWYKHHHSQDWQLMAPTGRAARRMTEVTGEIATTLHAGLNIPVRDESDFYAPEAEAEPISNRLIIVDEASMLDQDMMYWLLQSLRGDDYHLVLVGDSDQLPSVGAGNILADILASDLIPTVRLTEVFRQAAGNPIISNAARIRQGETELLWDGPMKRYNYPTDQENVQAACTFYVRCVNAYGIDNVAMLSPYRKATTLASDEINCALQEIINPAKGQPEMRVGKRVFRMYDRVMQLKNREEVKNGDVGSILKIGPTEDCEEPCLHVVYPQGELVTYTKDELNQLTLAYCMSVHKAQGSQYQAVIMLLPYLQDNRCDTFLRRNLLYTGLTRAEQYAAVFGPTETIRYSICNDRTDQRHTCLTERLSDRFPPMK